MVCTVSEESNPCLITNALCLMGSFDVPFLSGHLPWHVLWQLAPGSQYEGIYVKVFFPQLFSVQLMLCSSFLWIKILLPEERERLMRLGKWQNSTYLGKEKVGSFLKAPPRCVEMAVGRLWPARLWEEILRPVELLVSGVESTRPGASMSCHPCWGGPFGDPVAFESSLL